MGSLDAGFRGGGEGGSITGEEEKEILKERRKIREGLKYLGDVLSGQQGISGSEEL